MDEDSIPKDHIEALKNELVGELVAKKEASKALEARIKEIKAQLEVFDKLLGNNRKSRSSADYIANCSFPDLSNEGTTEAVRKFFIANPNQSVSVPQLEVALGRCNFPIHQTSNFRSHLYTIVKRLENDFLRLENKGKMKLFSLSPRQATIDI